jgi:hypothetical protein
MSAFSPNAVIPSEAEFWPTRDLLLSLHRQPKPIKLPAQLTPHPLRRIQQIQVRAKRP